MIRSIRWTLSLWYVGILAVTLYLFGWVLYGSVKSDLAKDTDDLLASQADGIADTIFAFLEAEGGADQSRNVSVGKELQLLVNRWAHEAGELEKPRPLRLLDPEGQTLYVTKSFLQLTLPVTPTALQESQLTRTVYETFTLPDKRIRLITRPVVEGGRVLYLIQAASSLRQADASLRRLRLWLLGLIPLTLLITSAVGWFLATTALRPVDRMINQAKRIRAEHLHERIDVPRTGDELERLAVTFNDLLARLEETFRRMRQFSAAASHELRTPLTIMKGELEVALRRPRTGGEYLQVLRAHLEALNQMNHIVEQLLVLARSEEGERAVEWRPVELGALIHRVRETWRKIWEPKEIEVRMIADGSVWVRGEQHLLERLVSNLLDNAIRHSFQKGRITLSLDSLGNQVCLTVKDTGSGIASDDLPKIFDRFFSRASEETQSTGLGLGLCRWIAEAHQGRIEVSSAAGEGAAFRVFLPLYEMKNL